MERLPSVLAAAAATLVMGTASAVAAPPVPETGTPEVRAAGEFCPFEVELRTRGKTGFIQLSGNGRWDNILTAPGLKLTVTNRATGASVTVGASGVFRDVFQDDGTVVTYATGQNVIYEPAIGLFARATTGPVVITQTADFVITDVDLRRASKVVDICAQIA